MSNLAQRWHVVFRDLYCAGAIHLPLPRCESPSPDRMTAEIVSVASARNVVRFSISALEDPSEWKRKTRKGNPYGE
jgi:hypothetical protein